MHPTDGDAAHVLAEVVPELEYELEFALAQRGEHTQVPGALLALCGP